MKIEIIKCKDSNNFQIKNQLHGFLFNPNSGLFGDEFTYLDMRLLLVLEEWDKFKEGERKFDIRTENILTMQKHKTGDAMMFFKHNLTQE